jgi:hypothetical protein
LLASIIAGSISITSISFTVSKVAKAFADMPVPRPIVSACSALGLSNMGM